MALFEALFVGSVLLAMLSLLFVGWKSPEIVVSVVNNVARTLADRRREQMLGVRLPVSVSASEADASAQPSRFES